MSLPACQQRVLDRMAQSLQASEPRLAAMYANFARLARDEPAPDRERLTARRLRWRASLPGRPANGSPGRSRISPAGLGVMSLAAPRPRHARSWLRVLAVSHLALIVVLGAVLITITAHSGPGCRAAAAPRAGTSAMLRAGGCQPVTSALTGSVSK